MRWVPWAVALVWAFLLGSALWHAWPPSGWAGLAVAGSTTAALASAALRRSEIVHAAGTLSIVALALVDGGGLDAWSSAIRVTVVAAVAACYFLMAFAAGDGRGAHLHRVAPRIVLTVAIAMVLTVFLLRIPGWIAPAVSPRWADSVDATSAGMSAIVGLAVSLLAAGVLLLRASSGVDSDLDP